MKFNYRHTILSCYLGYFVTAIVNNFPPLLFFTFQNLLGISLTQISFLIIVNFSVQILVDFTSARYVDRIGYRPCVVFADISVALGLVAMGILPRLIGYDGLLIAMVLNGVGGGLLEVLVSPIVQAVPDEKEKGSAMSMLHSFYCWGAMLVIILTTTFYSLFGTSHWYYFPFFWTIIPLLNALTFSFVPIVQLKEDGTGLKVLQLFREKNFWILALMMVCSGASELAISQWASYFAERALLVSKTVGNLFGPCFFAFLMGSIRLLYGKSKGKLNLRNCLLFSALGFFASLLLASLSPSPSLALLGCASCGAMVALFWPGTFSLSTILCPQGGTAMFALLAFFGDVGCALGPSVVSRVATEKGNFNIGLLAAGIFPLLLFVLLLFIPSKQAKIEK